MLALLVPGVGMGGNDGTAVADTPHLLMLMGVGRSWFLPFLLFLGVHNG